MSGRRPRDMNKREAEVLLAIVGLHREYGLERQFTRGAIEHVLGSPAAGSLAGLAMLGYAMQREDPEGLVYRVTATGWQAAELVVKGRRPVTVNGHDRSSP